MPKENIIPIENKKPVEEVRFWDYKEVKKSPLSVAARSKVISRHSSDYLSSRVISSDIAVSQMYGPGFWSEFWDDVKVVVKPVTSGALMAASVFPPTAAIALPVAIGVAGVGATAAGVGHITDNKKLKDFGKDIVDIGSNGVDGHDMADRSGLNAYARYKNQK